MLASLFAVYAHHAWDANIGMSALYAGTCEHGVVNVLPVVVAGAATRMSPAVLALWIAGASVNTVWAHAWENQHTVHHRDRTRNFGVGFMLVDRALGTLATAAA